MSDLDVVFFKNPWEMLINDYKDYDLVIPRTKDGPYDTSFYLANPTEKMIELFDFGRTKKSAHEYLNEELIKRTDLKIRELSELDFCPFVSWSENKDALNPYMIHYKGIGNGQDKVEMMQKNNHWFIK